MLNTETKPRYIFARPDHRYHRLNAPNDYTTSLRTIVLCSLLSSINLEDRLYYVTNHKSTNEAQNTRKKMKHNLGGSSYFSLIATTTLPSFISIDDLWFSHVKTKELNVPDALEFHSPCNFLDKPDPMYHFSPPVLSWFLLHAQRCPRFQRTQIIRINHKDHVLLCIKRIAREHSTIELSNQSICWLRFARPQVQNEKGSSKITEKKSK